MLKSTLRLTTQISSSRAVANTIMLMIVGGSNFSKKIKKQLIKSMRVIVSVTQQKMIKKNQKKVKANLSKILLIITGAMFTTILKMHKMMK